MKKIKLVSLSSWRITCSSKHAPTHAVLNAWNPHIHFIFKHFFAKARDWHPAHSLTFTSPPPLPISHIAAGSAVWCASVALYICIRCWFVHYLQFFLSTPVPSCVCTTCQLKWKYVAWWHTAHVRNGLEERRNPQPPGERQTVNWEARSDTWIGQEKRKGEKKNDYFNPFLRKFWDPLSDILSSGIKKKKLLGVKLKLLPDLFRGLHLQNV